MTLPDFLPPSTPKEAASREKMAAFMRDKERIMQRVVIVSVKETFDKEVALMRCRRLNNLATEMAELLEQHGFFMAKEQDILVNALVSTMLMETNFELAKCARADAIEIHYALTYVWRVFPGDAKKTPTLSAQICTVAREGGVVGDPDTTTVLVLAARAVDVTRLPVGFS